MNKKRLVCAQKKKWEASKPESMSSLELGGREKKESSSVSVVEGPCLPSRLTQNKEGSSDAQQPKTQQQMSIALIMFYLSTAYISVTSGCRYLHLSLAP